MRRSIISPPLHSPATSARKSEPLTVWISSNAIIASVIPASSRRLDARPGRRRSYRPRIPAAMAQSPHYSRLYAISLDHASMPTCGPRFIISPTQRTTTEQNHVPVFATRRSCTFLHLGRRLSRPRLRRVPLLIIPPHRMGVFLSPVSFSPLVSTGPRVGTTRALASWINLLRRET